MQVDIVEAIAEKNEEDLGGISMLVATLVTPRSRKSFITAGLLSQKKRWKEQTAEGCLPKRRMLLVSDKG